MLFRSRGGAGGKGQARPAGCEAKREPLPGRGSGCGRCPPITVDQDVAGADVGVDGALLPVEDRLPGPSDGLHGLGRHCVQVDVAAPVAGEQLAAGGEPRTLWPAGLLQGVALTAVVEPDWDRAPGSRVRQLSRTHPLLGLPPTGGRSSGCPPNPPRIVDHRSELLLWARRDTASEDEWGLHTLEACGLVP